MAALRANGQILAGVETGEGGLDGRMLSDLSAETALVYCVVFGVVGGEKYVELGRDGEARGMMSRGSGSPVA